MSDDPRRAPPSLPPDSSVLSITSVGDDLWLATDAGIWQSSAGQWQPQATPPGLQLATAIACPSRGAERTTPVLVGGLPQGIMFSVDDGTSWYSAWTDDIASGVTCFACSPRFAHDRVLLAGTERDGIVRSSDGGRRWQLANFGLTGFTVLALATSPDWDAREEAFAATDEGVYRSPNGGRAWKRVGSGIEQVTVQTLATSPQFARDRTLYAGCEGDVLYRSTDAGRSWHALAAASQDVNCIWIDPTAPDLLLVGTSEGALLRSHDAGESWMCVASGSDAVLALAAHNDTLYAGPLRRRAAGLT